MAWTNERLGEYLRQLREDAGLSHDRLGERVDKSRSQLIAYEQGKHDPGATFLMDVFEELGVQVVPPPVRAAEPRSVAGELRDLRESIDKRFDKLTVVVEEVIAQGRPEVAPEDRPPADTTPSASDVLP